MERPKTLEGTSTRVETGCGNLYVTVGCNGKRPIEVFATLGKAGGCSRGQNEALTRSISLGLKYGIPIKEYVEELEGIQCPMPNMWPKGDRILSCADGIAKVLREYIPDGDNEA